MQYGTCAFGVEDQGIIDGAPVAFRVGSQDIMDLINSRVSMFGRAGVVGAKGYMPCQGDATGDVNVLWGIYHT